MPRPLRYVPPGHMVEVTNRTIQGRYLLRPSHRLNELFIGVLAYAQREHPLQIHAFSCLSTHFHLLLTPEDAHQLAAFMCLATTNLSKEIGRLHDWPGPLFERRYRSVPLSQEVLVQEGRLEYILSQGCKEGLVARPSEWPGPNVAEAIVTGEALEGVWYDRTAEYEARRRGELLANDAFATRLNLELDVLPCWLHLPPQEARAKAAEMITRIEAETAARHRRERTRPLGADRVCRTQPHHRPAKISRSPAPLFHAATRAVYFDLYWCYASFVDGYREARAKLALGLRDVLFPPGSFPPPLPRSFTLAAARDGPG